MSSELTYAVDLGPASVRLRTAQPGLVDYLAEFYEITPIGNPEPIGDRTSWGVEARAGQPATGMARTPWGVGYVADSVRRHAVVVGLDPSDLAITVRKIVREVLVEYCEARGATMLHASAVTDGHRVVIVVGDKGAGKTTLALSAVLDSGWALLSNDHLLLYRDPAGGGLVATSLPTPIPVKVGTWGDWSSALGPPFDVEGVDPTAAAAMTPAQRYRSRGRFLYTYRGLGQLNPVHTRLPGRDVVVVLATYSRREQGPLTPEPVNDLPSAIAEHVRVDWWFDDACNTRLLPRDIRSRARFVDDSVSRMVELGALARALRWPHRGHLRPLLEVLDSGETSTGPATSREVHR